MKVIFITGGNPSLRSDFLSLLTARLDFEEDVSYITAGHRESLSTMIHARRSTTAPTFGIVVQNGSIDFADFQRHFPDALAVNVDALTNSSGALLHINTAILG